MLKVKLNLIPFESDLKLLQFMINNAKIKQYKILEPYLNECGFEIIKPFRLNYMTFMIPPNAIEHFYLIFSHDKEKYCDFEFEPVYEHIDTESSKGTHNDCCANHPNPNKSS